MKKILEIMIIFWISFWLLSFINNDDKTKVNTVDQNIIFKSLEKGYTVPAWIKILVENKTSKNIEIDICNDISIRYMQTDSILKLNDDFCDKNILVVEPMKKWEIDYSSVYLSFKDKWNYVFKTNVDWKELIANFEIESRWSIAKIFIYLFYAPAYNLIIFLVNLFSWSFWWAIITITVLLRTILLWPQHKMLVSQKALQQIQPKIKKIQEEFKWQPQVLGQKMMELYKTEKVNPMGSCGFLMIQMPILLVIYNVILHIKDESNHYYLYSFLQDFNLSSINYDFFWLYLISSGGVSWLILWLTVWSLQFIQIKLSQVFNKPVKKDSIVLEKKKGANDYSAMMPDPEIMQKAMLYWMPIMVSIFTYNFPAGVGIYWGISTSFMIGQQLIVNKKK